MQLQYPLRNLVGAVIACAVVCAVAIRPPIRLGSVSITIVVGVLFAAVLEAVFRRGDVRHFWIGFGILGWGYLVLVFIDPFRTQIGDQLLTSKLLEWMHSGAGLRTGQDLGDFKQFGQSMITLMLALLGGLASKYTIEESQASSRRDVGTRK
jgi:hypothetical protein